MTKQSFLVLLDGLNIKNISEPKDLKSMTPFLDFKNNVNAISAIEKFANLVAEGDLVDIGLTLIDQESKCPLCDLTWKIEDLKSHLTKKKQNSENAKNLSEAFDRLSGLFHTSILLMISKLESLKICLESIHENALAKKLSDWAISLKAINTKIVDIENVSDIKPLLNAGFIELLGYSNEKQDLLGQILKISETLPEESNEEKAYRSLLLLDGFCKSHFEAKSSLDERAKKLNVISKLSAAYSKARNNLFVPLYSDITKDFIRYYKYLNSEDESHFLAELNDHGKSLEMKVDFYQKGLFPPNALHSEGHQDSMGICIFLAIMNKLKGASFTIALLDDVMMSIDTNHRKKLCGLISTEFKEAQFIITTHDKIWADQLRRFGVVTKANSIYFRNWHVSTGPIFDTSDYWQQVDSHLAKNEVREAAPKLRRLLEHEYHEIGGGLKAKVPYNTSHSWDLGDLKKSSVNAFRDALGKAKNAANSFSKKEDVAKLSSIHEKFKSAIYCRHT